MLKDDPNRVGMFCPDGEVPSFNPMDFTPNEFVRTTPVQPRTKDSEDKEQGITPFVVDAKNAGISCTVLNSIASDRQCEVVLEDVRVSSNNILGEFDKGWKIVSKVYTT